jgi:hypothetical protein
LSNLFNHLKRQADAGADFHPNIRKSGPGVYLLFLRLYAAAFPKGDSGAAEKEAQDHYQPG